MERNWVVVEQILAEQTHGTVHRVNVHDNQQVPALKRTEMKKNWDEGVPGILITLNSFST